MGQVYIGCSGWAYLSWRPEFYPAKLPAKKLLEYYATRLNSVEVNYTFRSLPTEKTASAWLAAAGREFRFSLKAPQRITHLSRLKNCGAAFEQFVAAIQPVVDAGRMGVVLFQLPPNFKADSVRLRDFLEETSRRGLRFAFEFRNESWFADDIYSVLRSHGAALCIAESDELTTPDIATAPFRCYRLRRSNYSDAELRAIASLLKEKSAEGDVYAYFKHEDEPTGALRAVAVREMLE